MQKYNFNQPIYDEKGNLIGSVIIEIPEKIIEKIKLDEGKWMLKTVYAVAQYESNYNKFMEWLEKEAYGDTE